MIPNNTQNIPIHSCTSDDAEYQQELEEGGQTDEEEEEDNVGTYYHHPERRLSRNNISRSYGATSQKSVTK